MTLPLTKNMPGAEMILLLQAGSNRTREVWGKRSRVKAYDASKSGGAVKIDDSVWRFENADDSFNFGEGDFISVNERVWVAVQDQDTVLGQRRRVFARELTLTGNKVEEVTVEEKSHALDADKAPKGNAWQVFKGNVEVRVQPVSSEPRLGETNRRLVDKMFMVYVIDDPGIATDMRLLREDRTILHVQNVSGQEVDGMPTMLDCVEARTEDAR